MERAFSIAEVASRAGVSAQTLRHYDKLGLLKPSHVTPTGYRRYSDSDCARLRLIRALRAAGFDLATIGQLLNREQDPDEAIAMQLDALEAQRRALRRQQLILKAAMNGDASRQALLDRLEHKQALASLDKWERESFLATHLGWSADDPPESQAVWRAAIFDLPEEMNESQLEAWLELADIASDETFRETIERQRQPLVGLDKSRLLEWQQLSQRILGELVQAIDREGTECDQDALLERWILGFAKLHSRTPDAEFLQWMVRCFGSAPDPRMERYWELVSQIKALPPRPPVYTQAMDQLISGLRALVASSSESGS